MPPDYDNGTDHPQNDPYKEKLRNLAERIQVGDTDEGAAALEEAMNLARDQGANRESVRDAMHAEFRQMKFKAENDAALERFTNKYPSIATDSVLADAAQGVIKQHIVEDLRKAGMEEEELASVRGDVHRLADLHGKARIMGLDVRSADKLLEDSGRVLSGKFGIKPAQRNPREYVADLRKDRGFKDNERRAERAEAEDYGRSSAADDFGLLEARQERVRAMRASRGFPVSK